VIDILTHWVRYIIFVVLFASFIELLLPSSQMQRFVRVIMGLFIMLAILTPIIDLVQHRGMPTQIQAMAGSNDESTQIINHASDVAREREQLAAQLYKQEVAQQMQVMVIALDGVADAKVVIELNTMENHTLSYAIAHVEVYVTPGISKNGSDIKKIKIDGHLQEVSDSATELDNKIKKMIVELYQLSKDRVDIKMIHA